MTSERDIEPLYLHPHGAANEAVTLHEGPLTIQGVASGTGALVLRWLPSTDVTLEAELSSGQAPKVGTRVKTEVADSIAEVLVTSVKVGASEGASYTKFAGSVSAFEKGSGTQLRRIGFQVVNFLDFITSGPPPSPAFGFPPGVADLRHDGWRICLTAVQESSGIFKSLAETGGYAFTHLGCLARDDGSMFRAQNAENVLTTLFRFMSFARGAACSLPVRWGIGQKDDVIWESWGSPIVDGWQKGVNWFDEHHGNLLSEIFPAFAQTCADPELGEPFRLALHWYQKSNTRAGGMEGAIILGLTALDLLGALVVVDRAGAMGPSKYDGLSARLKLEKLLETMKVAPEIPGKLSHLSAFATANQWHDSAEALAEIRHGYVHAKKKRRQVVLSAPNLATYQAWQLSLWYQELALLYLLNHRGKYRNRLTAEWRGQVETVPWI